MQGLCGFMFTFTRHLLLEIFQEFMKVFLWKFEEAYHVRISTFNAPVLP